jgi:hypothetical protein
MVGQYKREWYNERKNKNHISYFHNSFHDKKWKDHMQEWCLKHYLWLSKIVKTSGTWDIKTHTSHVSTNKQNNSIEVTTFTICITIPLKLDPLHSRAFTDAASKSVLSPKSMLSLVNGKEYSFTTKMSLFGHGSSSHALSVTGWFSNYDCA